MKYSSNSILALTPPTIEGKLILKQSLFFQKTLGKRIFLLNVFKPYSFFSKVFRTKILLAQQSENTNQLKYFVKETIGKEVPKEILIRTKPGKLVSTLIHESKKGGYEFIIVDKSGGNYDGALNRQEVNKFVSKSHVPVLLINKEFPIDHIKMVVVPIDISQTVKKRLYWSTFIAKKFDAKIQIVSALNIKIDKTKSLAYKNAEKIKAMLLERGIECDVKILKAHNKTKHQVLLDYIEKKHPELVIIRTHQEYQFTGKKIGTFVSEIIRGCKMPVFTVGGSTENHPVEFNLL